MTETIVSHVKIGVMVCFAAALLSTIVNLSNMSSAILNGYFEKYVMAVNESSCAELVSLSMDDEVTGPTLMAVVNRNIENVHEVYLDGISFDILRDYYYFLTDGAANSYRVELRKTHSGYTVNITTVKSY